MLVTSCLVDALSLSLTSSEAAFDAEEFDIIEKQMKQHYYSRDYH